MNKSQLEEKIRLQQAQMSAMVKINSGVHIFYCAECGNPFMLNEDQFTRRQDKGRNYFCSAGHSNIFTKS